MENVRKNRTYHSLDLWRGVAAMMVVLTHSVANISSGPTYAPNRGFFVELCLWGDAGVPLFFVISGYCISAAAANTMDKSLTSLNFLSARCRRIYPTYLASLFLVILMGGIMWLVQKVGFVETSKLAERVSSLTPKMLITNSLLIQVPFHESNITLVSWTLCYELAFYAVVAVAIYAFRKRGWEAMLPALHVLTPLSLAAVVFAPRWALFPFDLWICFGEGVLLFDILCGRSWRNRTAAGKTFLTGVMVATVSLLAMRVIFAGEEQHHAWNTVIGTLFAVLLYCLFPFDKQIKQTKVLSGIFFIGGISYSLYLTHQLVIGLVRQVAKKIYIPLTFFGVEMLAVIMVAIAFAYVFYLLVESRFLSPKQRLTTSSGQSPL